MENQEKIVTGITFEEYSKLINDSEELLNFKKTHKSLVELKLMIKIAEIDYQEEKAKAVYGLSNDTGDCVSMSIIINDNVKKRERLYGVLEKIKTTED